jgi:hypothetical protein
MPTPVYAGPAITELKAGATTPTPINQYREAGTASPNGIIGQGAVGQVFNGVQGRGIAFNEHADAPIVGAPGGLDQPRQVASIPNLPAGFTPGGYNGPGTGGVNPYANKGSGLNFYKGGVIPEEVVGVGLQSGQPYSFGEKGPEGVIPNDQMPPNLKSKKPDLFDQLMSKGGDIHYTEDDGKTKRSIKIGQTPALPRQAPDTSIGGNNSYAEGGPIGADPAGPRVGPGDPFGQGPAPYSQSGPWAPYRDLWDYLFGPYQGNQIEGQRLRAADERQKLLQRSYAMTDYFNKGHAQSPDASERNAKSKYPGHFQTSDVNAPNSYAAGGTIGYNPNTPSLGSQSGGLFNPPDLQNVVSRGYNSSPQTPLFPQIGVATNNGQSLVASSQRLNSLLPSEQQLYSGTLQDEFGVQPDDVFAMARKLAPQVSGLHTPKYSA